MVLVPLLYLGGGMVDAQTSDDTAFNASGWVLTRTAAPGDRVAIRVRSHGGIRNWIQRIRARVGADKHIAEALQDADTVWKGEDQEDTVVFQVAVPANAPLGSARVTVDVDVEVHEETGRMLNTVYYSSGMRTDRLELPFVVGSEAGPGTVQLLTRAALASLAWLAACLSGYAVARWLFRKPKRGELSGARAVGCLVIAAIAIGGQLAFVRPILGSYAHAHYPWYVVIGAQAPWVTAIMIGIWRGLIAQRRDPQWARARLRAVVGTAREGGYREAGTTLPAMLSRDAPRCSADHLVAALRDLGCEVTAKPRTLHVSLDSEPLIRIRTRRPEPWLPEELELSVVEGLDASPIVAELTKLYGPLEYTPPSGNATIIAP